MYIERKLVFPSSYCLTTLNPSLKQDDAPGWWNSTQMLWWDWNIYLHAWLKFMVNVGIYIFFHPLSMWDAKQSFLRSLKTTGKLISTLCVIMKHLSLGKSNLKSYKNSPTHIGSSLKTNYSPGNSLHFLAGTPFQTEALRTARMVSKRFSTGCHAVAASNRLKVHFWETWKVD